MFGRKKHKKEIEKLNKQIELMRNHILAQNKKEMSLNRKISELEMLLDIERNTKRY